MKKLLLIMAALIVSSCQKEDVVDPEVDYCECNLYTRIYNGDIGHWEFDRTFLLTLHERCDKYNQEIKHLWRDQLIWEMNRRFFFEEDAEALVYQGLRDTEYSEECFPYE